MARARTMPAEPPIACSTVRALRNAAAVMISLGFAHHELRPDTVFNRGNAYTLPEPADVKKRLANIGWKHLKLDKKAKTVTLKGERIAEEFQAIVENYVRQRYGRPVGAVHRSGAVSAS